MIATWKKHCPYNTEEHPARGEAWRKGWVYQKGHGSSSAKEIERMMTELVLYASWLQGYSAADEHPQEAEPVVLR